MVSGPWQGRSTTATWGSKDPALHQEIKLPDVRWQAMPAEIQSAAVSPDGRIWYLMAAPAGKQDLSRAAVRAVVEREFAQSSPQLQGVKFVFFETAGDKPKRVWVMCRQSPVLLGYDGSRWIERRITNGVLPERFDNCPSFWQLDDAVVFLDTTGCQVLRGTSGFTRGFCRDPTTASNGGCGPIRTARVSR